MPLENVTPPGIARLSQLTAYLSQHSKYNDDEWWINFASTFFLSTSRLRFVFRKKDRPKEYTLPYALIPRFFQLCAQEGLTSLQFLFGGSIREWAFDVKKEVSLTECFRGMYAQKWKQINNGNEETLHVNLTIGSMVIVWKMGDIDQDCKIAAIAIEFVGCQLHKNTIASEKSQENFDEGSSSSATNLTQLIKWSEYGFPLKVYRLLEMAEVMERLGGVMSLFHSDPSLAPHKCLSKYISEFINAQNEDSSAQTPIDQNN